MKTCNKNIKFVLWKFIINILSSLISRVEYCIFLPIVFLDLNGQELDRFYGYLPAYEFIVKMQNVIDGKGTFTYYLDEYNQNNHSAEILSSLADKYNDKGETQRALALYMQLERTSNLSKKDFYKCL